MEGIKAVVFDIGGVLLTNGWDSASRKLAAKTFGFDFDLVEKRHQLMYSTYELGKFTLDAYVEFTYFSEKRAFSKAQFLHFMLEQSKPHEEMLSLARELKGRSLKVGVLSNEGRELSEYRVGRWLEFIDFFCISGFVGLRKPDPDIFRLAISIAQKKPQEIAYVEDREAFVTIGQSLGLRAIHHESYEKTKKLIFS